MQIFIHRDDQEFGPYSVDRITGFLADGSVSGEDYCRVAGDFEWSLLKVRLGDLFPDTAPSGSMPPKPNIPEPREEAETVDEAILDLATTSEAEAMLTNWDEIAVAPLLDGASPSAISKIMMGIESMRREDYEKALSLFHASLEEAHAVPAGWLGAAYSEAYMASIFRKTLENIRHAVSKAMEFCPGNKTIFDHQGIILSVAMFESAGHLIHALQDTRISLQAAKDSLIAHQKASTGRNGAIIVGTVAGVLGGRSKGAIGQMLGYGIAVSQTFKAIDAHGVANKSKVDAKDSVERAQNYEEIGRSFAYLIADIIKEARKVQSACNPNVQRFMDSTAKECIKILASFYTKELERVRPYVVRIMKSHVTGRSLTSTEVLGYPDQKEVDQILEMGRRFNLTGLPVYKNLESLFDDLTHIFYSPEFISLQEKELQKRSRFRDLGGVIAVVGACVSIGCLIFFSSIEVKGNNVALSAIAPISVLLGIIICISGICMALRSWASPLPIDAMVAERLDNLRLALNNNNGGVEDVELPFEEPSHESKFEGGQFDPKDVTDNRINEDDKRLICECLDVIRQEKKASTATLQRSLCLGFNRASYVIGYLERVGILGPSEGSKPRKILVDLETYKITF